MADNNNPPRILEWARSIIEGTGGMNAYERYEIVSWNDSDRVSAAYWALRCLASPRCEGSGEVLEAIMERRRELARADHESASD